MPCQWLQAAEILDRGLQRRLATSNHDEANFNNFKSKQQGCEINNLLMLSIKMMTKTQPFKGFARIYTGVSNPIDSRMGSVLINNPLANDSQPSF
jgi:hypothetical protein